MESLPQPDDRRLWTVKDAARFIKMSQKYVYRLIETGALPHFKLGRSVRLDPEHVESYLVQRQRGR
jgi:excisionase family DNA binding protein